MTVRDTLPTVWPADPHTLAKHEILRGYLNAWMPIVSRIGTRKSHILYVDAFAGPGEYSGGEPGSPLVALEAAARHARTFPIPVHMHFIEGREDRCKHLGALLQRKVAELGDTTAKVRVVEPVHGECETALRHLVEEELKKHRQLGPALFFLDQFGYSAVSMALISEILRHPTCEVFSFFNLQRLQNYITDETKWAGITRAFGGEQWKVVLTAPGDKAELLRELFSQALREKAGAKFSCSFAMHDEQNHLLYWLFFATKNVHGLEEMKKAMWRVDASGRFRFKDRHAAQLNLLKAYDDRWLASAMAQGLAGRSMTIEAVRDWVLVETPCCNYAMALKMLEKVGKVSVSKAPPSRKAGVFVKYLEDTRLQISFAGNAPP